MSNEYEHKPPTGERRFAEKNPLSMLSSLGCGTVFCMGCGIEYLLIVNSMKTGEWTFPLALGVGGVIAGVVVVLNILNDDSRESGDSRDNLENE